MRTRKIAAVALALICGAAVNGFAVAQTPVYRDASAPLESRVTSLFDQLTQSEKLSLLSGTGYATVAIPRLGIPAMGMADAGQGVRGGTAGTQGPATLFPSGVVMARTWDRGLIYKAGRAIGQEAQTKGTGAQVLLAPDVNIHRSPLGGRDGESFSEDPYDDAQIAVAYIEGVQSSGTAACVKHYICNNEEGDRGTVNVEVGERALREIYMPAFKAAVRQAHVWTIMAAYNQINGYHATANRYLLTDVLKNDWGFDGLAMSDWGAVHQTAAVVRAGLDLEMPGGQFLTPGKLSAALQSGEITQAQIDSADRRILRTMIRVGLLNPPRHPTSAEMVNSPEHRQLTFDVATEGIVLLKNSRGILPLDPARLKSIALIGSPAAQIQAGAEGSPGVTPFFQSEPLPAITARAGHGVTVAYSQGVTLPGSRPQPIPLADLSATGQPGVRGYSAQFFVSGDLSGSPALSETEPGIALGRGPAPALPGTQTAHSARWTATVTAPVGGSYSLALFTDSGCRVLVDGKPLIDSPTPGGDWRHVGMIDLTAGKSYALEVDLLHADRSVRGFFGWIAPVSDDIPAAVAAAAKSDVALVFVTTHGTDGEGRDRPSMDLPGDQDKLIESVAAVNKNTIVLVNSGTPVLMTPWVHMVRGIVDVGFPGEQGGAAIASILFGDTDPSGKLTDTIGMRREDYPDYGNFPGTNGVVKYAEGIYVGYRHFDKAGIAPLFPFGYGLSYTRFRYSRLRLSSPKLSPNGTVTATMAVTNFGKRQGADVVELYVHQPIPTVDRPVRELKGFERVNLKPGQTQTVTFAVHPQDFAYYDVAGKEWRADSGRYDIEIGASSRDIRLTKPVYLTGMYRHAD